MKHLNKNIKQELEFNYGIYQERESSFTHHGVKYDLNKALRLTLRTKPIQVSIKDLEWNLMTNLDEDRIKKAEIDYPLIVSLEKGVYYVLDGNHRLVKAYRLGMRSVLVKLISERDLESCRI